MSSPKFHTLTLKDVRKETSDCISVAFNIPANLSSDYAYLQGQYITMHKQIDGEEVRRSYSVCSSPLDGELRVAIKQVDNGKFSTYANKNFKIGDEIKVMTPMGNFYTDLNAQNKKHYVAFAAGSGITPILSIIKTTLVTEPNSTFTLVYGNKNTGSIMFLEEIEAIKNRHIEHFQVFHILSRESVDVPILNGRINDDKCRELLNKKLLATGSIDEIFICGPEDMIMSVKNTAIAAGIDSKHIHFELFTSPTQAAAQQPKADVGSASNNGQATSKVQVKIDGITYKIDLAYGGDSILDAALKAGADLPFACKGGVCCTCRAKVTSGTVDMDMNFALEDDEVEKGYVLTCQSHPTSVEVFVDFDLK
ncbi:MAG: phenylacetate-CoA oxygenase/reductase subunit PaaK [Bacteroidetes bacterium]|nr:phenylacetate-CoA oxygenase/reductase subunit PaaK [Bacteroidota bacterium]